MHKSVYQQDAFAWLMRPDSTDASEGNNISPSVSMLQIEYNGLPFLSLSKLPPQVISGFLTIVEWKVDKNPMLLDTAPGDVHLQAWFLVPTEM